MGSPLYTSSSTNPNKADTDGDVRDDGQEVFDKTDPNSPFD